MNSVRDQYVEWIEGLTNWTTKLDMTFSWNCDEFRAAKLFRNWMVSQLPSSTFLFSVERDPNQDKVMNTKQGLNQACHVHAISDTDWHIQKQNGTTRKSKWDNWFGRYGRCRIEPVKHISGCTAYAMKKILNYSEAREEHGHHMRKTDVDWDLIWGKGRRAKERRDEASQWGQEFMALGHSEFARRKSGHKNYGSKERKVNARVESKQEDLFPWQVLGRKEA